MAAVVVVTPRVGMQRSRAGLSDLMGLILEAIIVNTSERRWWERGGDVALHSAASQSY